MPFTLAALCTALTITACSSPEPPHMLTAYFEDDFRFWNGDGPSSLTGTIAAKLDNGEDMTCAGSSVILMPATAYNTELEQYLEQGRGFPADYSHHAHHFNRTVTCDKDGRYFAGNLPSVKWIVAVHVSWSKDRSVPGMTSIFGQTSEGGWIFSDKTLAGGENTLNLTKEDLVRQDD